jgi:penicillin-binding protein 1C
VEGELAALAGHDISQAAAVVLDNASGEVLAYVGSASFFDSDAGGQNDGVRSLRQPGSALKPFAYGLGLASGWTPATVLADVETHLSTPSGAWVPKNYDRRVHGPVRLRAALANSYNVPAVRITDELGADRVLEVLRDAGFASLDADASRYGAGIVLGNGDTTLWELARAFRGLAKGGVVGPLRRVLHAVDPIGAKLEPVPELAPRRFLPADAVALLTDVISDEGARSPAFGMDNALRLPFPVAAKTGTSRAYVDNWTVGYTAERTVAVWVGNFDGRPMRRVSGITGAGPLFRRIMEAAMEGVAPGPLVDRGLLTQAAICPLSGGLATERCPHHLEERFLPGTEPKERCAMHERDGGRVVMHPGPRFLLWAQAEGLDAAEGTVGEGRGSLILPMDGDEYLLDPSIPLADQSIPLRVLPPAGFDSVWVLTSDGRRFPLRAPFSTRIPATRGAQEVQVWVDGADAPLATARFLVR